ncbi:hypothetical protein RHS03_08013, partial [Rhizoctonia solani]
MPRPNSLDLSHRICYVPNMSLRLIAHGSDGRLRILFDGPEFMAWRGIWGSTVFFKRLEYRKLRSGVQHEFILLRGLSKSKNSNELRQSTVPPNLSNSTSSPATTNSNPIWWTNVPDNVYEYVLKFEREASPEHQLNALVRTEAYDYVDFKEFAYLSSNERSSTVELAIEFPEPVALEQVIKISASISKHQDAQLYTLSQFNCFFYCWNIVAILLRLHVDWAIALRSDATTTTQLLTARMVELSDTQRTRPGPRNFRAKAAPELRPNLALLLAGEYSRNGLPADSLERKFIKRCQDEIENSFMFRKILDLLQLPHRFPLWIRDDLGVIRDHVRELLHKLADLTIGLAIEGTEESTISDLFLHDRHIEGLAPKWKDKIEDEVNKLIDIYLNRMWSAFGEALKQTEAANRAGRFVDSKTMHRRSNALQRIGNSPLILRARLTPVGLRAAWNAAQLRASLNPIESPVLPLIMLMRTLKDIPNQVQHVSGIAANFVSVLSMRRDVAMNEMDQVRAQTKKAKSRPQPQAQLQFPGQFQAPAQAQATTLPPSSVNMTRGTNPLSLERSNVLGMMSDINLMQPELEDQVVCELEKSIKDLALTDPKCSMHELRLVTLEMLICLKEKGKKINFGLPFQSIWKICLWYCLGEEITKVLEEAAERRLGNRIRCWLRKSKSDSRGEEQPMLVSEIHTFIHERIKNLSEMIHNQRGPGAPEACRKEIENAMDTVWRGVIGKDISVEVPGEQQDRRSSFSYNASFIVTPA